MTASDRVRAAWRASARDDFLKDQQLVRPHWNMREYNRRAPYDRFIRNTIRALNDESGWVAR